MSLKLFNFIVFCHFAEHIAQLIELYLLHWSRPECLGILGLWLPWLVRSEWLHYGHALFMLLGLAVISKNNKWLFTAFILAFYHHLEHLQLLLQAINKSYFFGATKPVTLLELIIPRIELHFLYNLMVLIPMITGLYFYHKQSLKRLL